MQKFKFFIYCFALLLFKINIFAEYHYITKNVSFSDKIFEKNSYDTTEHHENIIAISGAGTLTLNNIQFLQNGGGPLGGIIANHGVLYIYNTTFDSNYTGRCIACWGQYPVPRTPETTIGDNVIFNSNKNVIENNGGIMNMGKNVIFNSNIGIAIINSGTLNIDYKPEFVSNNCAIVNTSKLTIKDGANFINNITTVFDSAQPYVEDISQAGAIYNKGYLVLSADNTNIEFTGNKAQKESNAIYDEKGGIFLGVGFANIIFNDKIKSYDNTSFLKIGVTTSALNNATGKIILNEDMSEYTGVVDLNGGIEIELQSKKEENLNINTNKFFSGNINLSSGTLNILNNSIDDITISTLTTTSNVNLKIDVDLSNNSNDNFTVTDTTMGEINLTAINIWDVNNNSGQITLFNNGNSPQINILTKAFYGMYEYSFENSEIAGILNYQKTGKIKTLKEIVNETEPIIRSCSFEENEIVTEDIGFLGGTQLTIFGNGYDINGHGNRGILVGFGQTLSIENVNSWNNFNEIYGAIKNEGTLLVSGTNFTGNIEQDIINNGNLVLYSNSSSFEKGIIGLGTTEILEINIYLNSAEIRQNMIQIDYNGILTANASNVTSKIWNNSSLIFTNGINNNYIYGKGTTIIDGEVINSSTIVNSITINENKQLTTNASDVIGDISNAGNYLLTGGENNNWIYGIGTTIINGEVINSSTIVNSLTINKNKKLSTNSESIVGNIVNNGTLLFNAGTINNNKITGVGTLNVTANNFINNNLIDQKIVEISKESSNISNVASSNSQQELNNFINNSTIKAENLNLKSINLKLIEKGLLSVQTLSSQNSEIDLANLIIQQHNFETISLTDTLNLSVDADLANKKMDTITANSFSGNGKINVKAINILNDAKENKTEILFTSSTVLKDKITSINTASSKLYKYDVNYSKDTGIFKFFVTATNSPIIVESLIASATDGLITQTTILNQAFSSIDNIRNRIIQAKQKGLLYASTADVIFESSNRIESGLWIRPFMSQDTISFDSLDVDNNLTGTLAGIDLVAGENSLLSFYLGYAGSNQKYEDIKVNQTGYIVGVTGMIIKGKWYAGLTANINFNKAESQSVYGTDSFDLNMYSVGAKAGYNFDLSDKWILEPNLMLMYGNVNSQEYETTQGAKIDSQSTANIIVEPQVKAKLSLDNGWQPYGWLGYLINAGEKAKLVADNIVFDDMGISGYVEYGLGVNKTFKNSPWSCYLQLTGKSGDISGFDGNIGIKYSFLNKKEKEDIEFIKYLKKKEKEEIKEQKKIESEKLAKQKALQEEQRRIEKEEKARLEAEEKARIEEEKRLKKEEQDRQKALEQERIKAEKAEKEKQKLLEIERKIQENYN